ncbi:MAG TPA: NUDIX domain-containing protein [Actinomycetota bacterium]
MISAHHRVVAGALRKDGRVLLCHRSSTRTSYPNVWDLPGGHVEEVEDERDALVRELAEELGVRVRKPAEPPFARLLAEGVGGEPGVELSVWAVDHWDGGVVNQSPGEHDRLGWFSPTELGDLDLAHPSYVAVLSELLAGAASTDR